ncbi:MAG TPA: hypothetical protein VKR32_12680, partial [Puia sp.]|nr:hypothetical protein [Puia sp.]
MNPSSNLVPIPGSHREIAPNVKLLRLSDPTQKIKISIYARENSNPPAALLARVQQLGYQMPKDRAYFTDEEYDAVFGADPADLREIVQWAKGKKL